MASDIEESDAKQIVYLAEFGYGSENDDPGYTVNLGLYSKLTSALSCIQDKIMNEYLPITSSDFGYNAGYMIGHDYVDVPENMYDKYNIDITTETELDKWCELFSGICYPNNCNISYGGTIPDGICWFEPNTWYWRITKMTVYD